MIFVDYNIDIKNIPYDFLNINVMLLVFNLSILFGNMAFEANVEVASRASPSSFILYRTSANIAAVTR